ncbi:MAG: ribonuclease Z [Proteobacteria bacterium]|nr:ribonuclease Z [Pseudomonadota bacterium]
MEWIILGSGTLEMVPDRSPACHLLRGDQLPWVLVDTGPGCLQRLAELGVDPRTLSAVVHSHRHLDHLADLFPLLFHRSMSEGRLPELVLSGAPDHEQFVLQAAKALYPKLLQTGLAFHKIDASGRPHPLPGTRYRITAWPAAHSQSARILRIEGDSPAPWSVCYSGDTGPCPELVEAATGVDWLVIECTTPDDSRRANHLTARDVAEVVAQVRPKGTALVHLSPLWAAPSDAAAVVSAHLGTLVTGESPHVVGGTDGLRLSLPYGS